VNKKVFKQQKKGTYEKKEQKGKHKDRTLEKTTAFSKNS